MQTSEAGTSAGEREAAGFLATAVFAGLAAVRDVYLARLFQHTSPLAFAFVAFALCSLIFVPIAAVWHRESVRRLLGRPGELGWINATTAAAWLSFFLALRTVEPSLVQVLFSGIGPISVLGLDRLLPGAPPSPRLAGVERLLQLGIVATLAAAAIVIVTGLSAAGSQPWQVSVAGVGLAVFAGTSISVSTVLCRRMNDAGVAPTALVSLRFVGAAAVAAVLAPLSLAVPGEAAAATGAAMVLAALFLIVVPIYVSQVGIALASPITVRVVLAATPAMIFGLQLAEGRLSSSACSLAVTALYGGFAVAATIARQRNIRLAASPRPAGDLRALPSAGPR